VTLQPRDIVILDNLSVDKNPYAAGIVRTRGAWILLLPQPEPDRTGFLETQSPSARSRRASLATSGALPLSEPMPIKSNV
jgi:hypothetical protein